MVVPQGGTWQHFCFAMLTPHLQRYLSGYIKFFACWYLWALVFGIPHSLFSETLIRVTDPWHFKRGSDFNFNDQVPPWYSLDYDDSSWQLAKGGFSGGFNHLLQATHFSDFGSSYHSVFFRNEFEIVNLEEVQLLVLRLQFRHGCVLWLNGHPIYNSGFGELSADDITLNQRSAFRSDDLLVELSLNHAIPLLKEGTNILGAQVHAAAEGSSFVFVAELSSNFSRQPMVHQLYADSAVISWKTLSPYIGKVNYGLVRNELNHSVEFEEPSVEPEVLIDSLKAGCLYYYQVELETVDGVMRSSVSSFTTPDPDKEHLRFAVLGDSGRGSLAQYRIADQIRNARPEMVLHTGDMVYPSLTSDLVDFRHYSIYGLHMRSIPYYLAIGNHDLDKGFSLPPLLFHSPMNDTPPEGHAIESTFPEAYYTFNNGPAQFFVLFAPFFYQYELKEDGAQHRWLVKELERSQSHWKFFVVHHPIRTSSLHRFDDYNRNGIRDTEELGSLLLSLANRFGVSLIFTGHDHVYERFTPDSGVVALLTAGGGGNLYPLREHDQLSSVFRKQHHFLNVEIDGNTCRLEAIDDGGNVIDNFTFRQPTEIEHIHSSSWQIPHIETEPVNDGDGNIIGQHFDFTGAPLVANLGSYSHGGTLNVHNDLNYLYLGFQSVSLPDDGALMVFLGTENEAGDEAKDELSFLKDLHFENWKPQLIGVLGDEYADSTQSIFDRSSSGLLGPQGLFFAGGDLQPVTGARLQQYNISPQLLDPHLSNTHLTEQNANFIEMAIPLGSISGIELNGSLKLSVITGRQPMSDLSRPWSFDNSLIGGTVRNQDSDGLVLQGVSIQLSSGPDSDGDGLSDPEEMLLQSNPEEMDTDGDTLPDGWEVRHGLSPLLAASSDGPHGDPDHDGLVNFDEWLSQTDPGDPDSALELYATLVEPGVMQLSWLGMPQVTYALKTSHSPDGPYEYLGNPAQYTHPHPYPQILKHHVSVSSGATLYFQLELIVEAND